MPDKLSYIVILTDELGKKGRPKLITVALITKTIKTLSAFYPEKPICLEGVDSPWIECQLNCSQTSDFSAYRHTDALRTRFTFHAASQRFSTAINWIYHGNNRSMKSTFMSWTQLSSVLQTKSSEDDKQRPEWDQVRPRLPVPRGPSESEWIKF